MIELWSKIHPDCGYVEAWKKAQDEANDTG
jgi:hypothetical protein